MYRKTSESFSKTKSAGYLKKISGMDRVLIRAKPQHLYKSLFKKMMVAYNIIRSREMCCYILYSKSLYCIDARLSAAAERIECCAVPIEYSATFIRI